MLQTILSRDSALFLLINRGLANPLFDAFFATVTNGKFWIVPGIAAALIYLICEKKKALVVLGLALVTVTLTDQLATDLLKPLVHRLRPCNPHALVEGGRYILVHCLRTSYSFPSNHAMNMFGQAMLLTLFYPRFGVYFFSFAGIIGFSRIYVGVHYPLDVAGGAVFGVVCGAIVWAGYRFVIRRLAAGKSRRVFAHNEPLSSDNQLPH
jgi:undecaprenyl-diphosphatase